MAEYKKIPGEDSQSSDNDSVVAEQWTKYDHLRNFGVRTVIFILLVQIITYLAIVLLLAWILKNQTSYHNLDGNDLENTGINQARTDITSCGSTPAEAIAAHCFFDLFSFGWTPPECTDLQLYNESLTTLKSQLEGSPAFYTLSSSSSPLPLGSSKYTMLPFSAIENYALGTASSTDSELLMNGKEVFATWEYYLVSCTYGWQKVQRAAMRNWPLEEWSASYSLAAHCGPDLLTRQKRESESIVSRHTPWYPRCGLEAKDLRREIADII
ncbi:uncharacterized protein N7483_003849 [Penicillium malachiteum]|uniref:uncharacterized protein n=1 Tax=Penicillium malachiteum TaxID=1324776 RepID=UPI002548111D|nr:uncharacterized protein N7483_003849 [Penicillium malachiteum]KAJ5729341.1 hypothetical protein N7483_003849 [Penicillium malachiteum]